MNLNAAVEALDSVRFFDCRMADMEGVEPSPLSRTRERRGLPAGESGPGVDGHPFVDSKSTFP